MTGGTRGKKSESGNDWSFCKPRHVLTPPACNAPVSPQKKEDE